MLSPFIRCVSSFQMNKLSLLATEQLQSIAFMNHEQKNICLKTGLFILTLQMLVSDILGHVVTLTNHEYLGICFKKNCVFNLLKMKTTHSTKSFHFQPHRWCFFLSHSPCRINTQAVFKKNLFNEQLTSIHHSTVKTCEALPLFLTE